MRLAIDALQTACTKAFDAYADRAELNEKKADMMDYVVTRGWLNGRQIAEAREFARLKEEDE